MTLDPTGPVGDAVSNIGSQGVLGSVVVLILAAATMLLRREWKRSDGAQAKADALNDEVRTQTVPALTRAADGQARATEELAKVAALLPDVVARLDRLERLERERDR